MTTALQVLGHRLAERFGMGDNDVVPVLKATAFKGQATDAQLTALLVVAQQHGLNPFTKEIYAFPDRQNGIVPVVGVDGWSRIINSHDQFDGMDFVQDEESCTCVIHRKDRGHPIRVTEWMAECRRDGVGPWKSHPKRMLRHKAMIQCARLAFGFTGIFDQDEAERIAEVDAPKVINPNTGEITTVTFDVVVALDAVERCNDLPSLQDTWKEQGTLAVAAKDKTGHAQLKQAVKDRKATLEDNLTLEAA